MYLQNLYSVNSGNLFTLIRQTAHSLRPNQTGKHMQPLYSVGSGLFLYHELIVDDHLSLLIQKGQKRAHDVLDYTKRISILARDRSYLRAGSSPTWNRHRVYHQGLRSLRNVLKYLCNTIRILKSIMMRNVSKGLTRHTCLIFKDTLIKHFEKMV